MDMVVVEVVQVHGLTLTKTPETLVGLVVAVVVVLASPQVMAVHKILEDMVLLVMEDQEIKLEKVKQVLTHLLTLVVMVAVVVYMEKVLVVQEMVVQVETKTTLLLVVLLEVLTEVVVDHQEHQQKKQDLQVQQTQAEVVEEVPQEIKQVVLEEVVLS